MTNTGFIIGAYPCAPSFHQKGEQEELAFWRELSDTPYIRGLEQPCLESLHPFGDEWLFRHTPGDWQIVVTAVMFLANKSRVWVSPLRVRGCFFSIKMTNRWEMPC